jgi:hypothetical protein
MKALKLRTIAERRHNGGQIVKVYELASSGTFTLNLAPGGERGGLEMFASAEEAQQAADDRLLGEGHDCGVLGCTPWLAPAPSARKSS